MASIRSVKVGDVLYDVRMQKTGCGSRKSCWTVHVLELDVEANRVLTSWNGNAPQWWPSAENYLKPLRRTRPTR